MFRPLCSIVSCGGVGISTSTAVCATRTEIRRMDGQADLQHMSKRIRPSVSCPPPCATSNTPDWSLSPTFFTNFHSCSQFQLWGIFWNPGNIPVAPKQQKHTTASLSRLQFIMWNWWSAAFSRDACFFSHRHPGSEASQDSSSWGRFVHFACLVI